MRRTATPTADKRKQGSAEPRRPAGIQNIDPKLYAEIARAIRSLKPAAVRGA